jgi:nitroreductase
MRASGQRDPETMSDVTAFLQQRNSAPRLTEPAPDAGAREQIYRAALRVPDHARLRPWRFVEVEKDRRHDLGRLFEASLLRLDPNADSSVRDKALAAPLRAPLIVVVFARPTDHPKVPPVEQRLSAACAAHAILLAAESLGYAGMWRTGNPAYDPEIVRGLGGAADEEIIAFLYLGTRDGDPRPLPPMETEDFVSRW